MKIKFSLFFLKGETPNNESHHFDPSSKETDNDTENLVE